MTLVPHSYTAKDVTEYFDSLDRSYGKSEWTDWLRVVALRGCDGPNDRNAIIEECADLADQKLDQFSGTECTYRCDVAEAIRELKRTDATSHPQEEK